MGKAKKRKIVKIPAAAKDASPIEKADVAVARAMAPHQDSLPVQLLTLIGKLGDQPPMLTISAAVLAAGIFGGKHRLTRAGIRMIAAHVIATDAKNFAKHRIDRTRPALLVEEGRYKMEPGDNESKEQTSFPSGHSAGAIAVARAFGREFPEFARAAEAAATTIALAQIPRCAHYPTDVAAGLALGVVSEAVVNRAAKALSTE